MERLSTRELLWLRMDAQGLARREHADPITALRSVCGTQAQDAAAGMLSLRARGTGFTASEVHDLMRRGRVVRTWCMRGTLHLLAIHDLSWLVSLLGPVAQRSSRRRLRQLDLDAQSLDAIGRALREFLAHGRGATRGELVELLASRGIALEGQAVPYALRHHALGGTLVLVEDSDGDASYRLINSVRDGSTPSDRRGLLARLAARYLAAYGPATLDDFASWSGLGKRDARTGWDALAEDAMELVFGEDVLWAHRDALPRLRALRSDDQPKPCVRLLPAYDTSLLCHASRDVMIADAFARRVHPGGGLIRPSVMVDGRLEGSWRATRGKDGMAIEVELFESLPGDVMEGIETEVRDIGRFLGISARLA